MAETLIMQTDGKIKKNANGSLSDFSLTTMDPSFPSSSNVNRPHRFFRTPWGELYILETGNTFATKEGKIHIYDPETDKIHILFDSVTGAGAGQNQIYGFGKELIWLYSDPTEKYRYSLDGGVSWSNEFSLGISSIIGSIIKFKNVWYITTGEKLYTFSLGTSETQIFDFGDVQNSTSNFAVLNDKLYIASGDQTGTDAVRIHRITGASVSTVHSEANGFPQQDDHPCLVADPVNDKLYMMLFNHGFGTKCGAKTTDGTGDSWVTDATMMDNITLADSTFRGGVWCHAYSEDDSFSKIQGLYIFSKTTPGGGYSIVEWNSSNEEWDELGVGAVPCWRGFIPYKADNAFSSLLFRQKSSNGTRMEFDLLNRKKDGTNITVSPKFSEDLETSAIMNTDEGAGANPISNQVTILPDVTIGSSVEAFNDDFSSDRFSTFEGYLYPYEKNIKVDGFLASEFSILSGALKFDYPGSATLRRSRIIRRFVFPASSNFKISIEFLNWLLNLPASGNIFIGLEASIIGSNGDYVGSDENVFIGIKKTSASQLFHSYHTTGGVQSILAGPAPTASGKFYIERTGGNLFSSAYGEPETDITPVTPLNDSGAVLVSLLMSDDGSSQSNQIDYKNLKLESGPSPTFVGHRRTDLNWSFGDNGILTNKPNMAVKCNSE